MLAVKSTYWHHRENAWKKLTTHNNKITYASTIFKYSCYLQKLTQSLDLDYNNITEDIGAPPAYIILNYSLEFGNIAIHPGGFHMLIENYT